MEKLTGNRRTFLKFSGGLALSGLVTPPLETQKPLENFQQEFIMTAQKVGGVDTLGYRLSNPWQDMGGLWNVAYQQGILKRDLDGTIKLREILDDLSRMGLDPALNSGKYGDIVVPPAQPLSDRDYLNIPEEITKAVDDLSKKGADPGYPKSPSIRYEGFEVVRFQRMALQKWSDGRVERILIGQALGQLGFTPQEALLVTPKLDTLTDCLPAKTWEGRASYYSFNGCIGCSRDRRMANGEIFNENDLTLAFMRLPLNSLVRVENTLNGISVNARVTDRGWFELWGRIADLSKGLKDTLGGEDITQVRITQLICKNL